MAGPNNAYLGDGCGGIHSADVGRAVANGDLYEGSDGYLHSETGGCYGTDGTYYGGEETDDDE